MANIAIVTDTSSDLTPQQAASAGVRLVPLTVSFGDETFEAVTELSNEEFYKKLTAPGAPFPKTAAPNPAQFEAAFREALEAGADGVVCITISGKLSATYSSAVQAAGGFEPGQVEVVDSLTTTLALALIVKRAVAAATAGASHREVVELALGLVGRSSLMFTPDTLEYLQKGGRIGRASALVGTVLSIKPILYVDDGMVASLDRKRTTAKARARMLELAGAADVEHAIVLHTGVPDVEAFRDEVATATRLPAADIEIGLTGPVAGSHLGPGMVGISRILTA